MVADFSKSYAFLEVDYIYLFLIKKDNLKSAHLISRKATLFLRLIFGQKFLK